MAIDKEPNMELPESPVSRRSFIAASLALIPLLSATTMASPAYANGTFPEPGPVTPRNALLTYADLQKELRQLTKSTQGRVKVATLHELGIRPGRSEAGRELYVATVGTGSTHVWLQGRIHGNEPYGTDTLLDILKKVGSNGSGIYERIRNELTLHVIPMYNPDGTELYIRHTVKQDGSDARIDLNRDWKMDGFTANESIAWYTYWTRVKPAYGLDIHHQGLKLDQSDNPITMSLGISLAPSGPTLPGIREGEYDIATRSMASHAYLAVKDAGFTNVDRYSVGNREIDILGGVASAAMLGLNWNGLNPTNHSHPMIFFETYGGSIGQKSRGKAIEQNLRGTVAILDGLASGSIWNTDPMIWHNEIPHVPYVGYLTDTGNIDGWPTQPPVQ